MTTRRYSTVAERRAAAAPPIARNAVTALTAAAGNARSQQTNERESLDVASRLAANAPKPAVVARAVLEPTGGNDARRGIEAVESGRG